MTAMTAKEKLIFPSVFLRVLRATHFFVCFVVCSQVRDGEVRILFKVLEYDHLPVLNLLGDLLTAAITQPQKTEGMQEQFQKQIREGAPMVEARIRQAIGK